MNTRKYSIAAILFYNHSTATVCQIRPSCYVVLCYGTMYFIYYDNLTLICLHNGMQLSSTQSIAAAVIFCVLLLSLLLLACHASYIAKDCKRKRLQTAVRTMYNREKECMEIQVDFSTLLIKVDYNYQGKTMVTYIFFIYGRLLINLKVIDF